MILNAYSAYLVEDFESPFVGSPPAPLGWQQQQIRTVQNSADEQDWLQNTWNGSSWSILSTGNNTNTLGAKSGSSALWVDDYSYMRTTTPVNARRMISPIVNLSASSSPYLRFWYFNSQSAGQGLNVRVLFSSDGGASWNQVAPILNGWDSAANRWNRINIPISASYRTSNFKFAFEITNRLGASNPFIDLVAVEEFTPLTITSTAAGGNWLNPSTWVGGVVPNSDNNVVIAASANVVLNAIGGVLARCQNLQINGLLRFPATTSTAIYAAGNITISSTGRLNAFNGASGRTVMCGGNFNNQGAINFAIPNTAVNNSSISGLTLGAATLIMFGTGGSSFQNTGTIDSNRINNLWIISAGTVSINSPITVSLTLGLYDGTLIHNNNLTLGNAGANNQVQTIERHKGILDSDPVFDDTRIASRNNTYITTNFVSVAPVNITLGSETAPLGRSRIVTGVLRLETFNNLFLEYPLVVGTTSSGGLILTKGILSTDTINNLRTSSFFAPPTGVAPTTIFPSSTAVQGSYIYGPIRVDFPSSSSSRSFPIGYGNQPVGSAANSNKLLTFSLSTTTAWTSGTSVTARATGKPSGSVNSPLTLVMGTRGYNLSINEGPDLTSDAFISGLRANNYTYGDGTGSDSLLGNRQNLFISQSTSLSGTWSVRSVSTSSGAFVNNTEYTRNTSVTSPGPISPISVKGGYFAWATNAPVNPDASPVAISPSGTQFYPEGAAAITMTGVVKNNGLIATTSTTYITRKILGTRYVSTTTVPSGLAVGVTANTSFDDFTEFVSGVNYQIKDSVFTVGDLNPANDTLSTFFIPIVSKKILVLWDDQPSRDSLINHLNLSAYASNYDVAPVSGALPNLSLSNWKTIFVLYASTHSFSSIIGSRDSLKNWLDNSADASNKRTLCIFGNDLGSLNDPISNPSALPADTIFYRKYLRAKFLTDNWLTASLGSEGKFKGTAPYFSSITGDSLYDSYPDAVAPASWNGGLAAFLPKSNFAGDTACAIYYIGNFYNVFYGTNVYSSYRSKLDGSNDNPVDIFNQIVNFIQVNNGVAPVELSSFSAIVEGNNVTLNWSTISEENNSGFNIEKKSANISNLWSVIGHVNGSGTTNLPMNYSFTEKNLNTGRYSYRLKQIDFNGNYKYYELANEVSIGVPMKFSLAQNYPNPFNPFTNISYSLPKAGFVSIKIYDIAGRMVKALVNEFKEIGNYNVVFDGSQFASGVYFYRLEAKDFMGTKRMALVK